MQDNKFHKFVKTKEWPTAPQTPDKPGLSVASIFAQTFFCLYELHIFSHDLLHLFWDEQTRKQLATKPLLSVSSVLFRAVKMSFYSFLILTEEQTHLIRWHKHQTTNFTQYIEVLN